MSQLIHDMLEDQDEVEEEIPLAKVSAKQLKDILEYCEHY
eukprot:CAMPEP_0116888692 /NCGR_PEP_ID=MMETSP0463-20121206/23850_1 /TAXON_ID=181622 /ORGANISM="Strombidinopsis sp, Strain SopsisLIS2011" /LENGTH=39 /DNA_ID= /DNA_START= /DNA_END= /DNA_ORIENTATION=